MEFYKKVWIFGFFFKFENLVILNIISFGTILWGFRFLELVLVLGKGEVLFNLLFYF